MDPTKPILGTNTPIQIYTVIHSPVTEKDLPITRTRKSQHTTTININSQTAEADKSPTCHQQITRNNLHSKTSK